jgi:hypothetical protein
MALAKRELCDFFAVASSPGASVAEREVQGVRYALQHFELWLMQIITRARI